MQPTIIILLVVLLLVIVIALLRRSKKRRPTGGNAVNTDPELESLYSLLGDNSGRMKK